MRESFLWPWKINFSNLSDYLHKNYAKDFLFNLELRIQSEIQALFLKYPFSIADHICEGFFFFF